MVDKTCNGLTFSSPQQSHHQNSILSLGNYKPNYQPPSAALRQILSQLEKIHYLSEEEIILSDVGSFYRKIIIKFQAIQKDSQSQLALSICERIKSINKRIRPQNKEVPTTCQIRKCEDIVSNALQSPASTSIDDYKLFLAIIFSRGIGGYTLNSQPASSRYPFPALPNLVDEYRRLQAEEQVSIEILLYLTSTLIKLEDLKSDKVKELVKMAFRLNETSEQSKEVVSYFDKLERLARKIFDSKLLRPLRAIFYEDFKRFDEMATVYGLFKDEENSLLKMLVIMTKSIIGLQLQIQEVSTDGYLDKLKNRIILVERDYPHLLLPFMLLELMKCRKHPLLTEVRGIIERQKFNEYVISKEIAKLASVRLIYCLTQKKTANMRMMLQKCSTLMGIRQNLDDKINCCIYSIAATLILNSNASHSPQILNNLENFPEQKLEFILRFYKSKQELVSCVIKTITSASQYNSYFVTFQDLKEQVDFSPKIEKITMLKHRLFSQKNEKLSSPQFTDDSHIQLAHKVENFKNEVESKIGDNRQYYKVFLEIVGETISYFGIKDQLSMSGWKKALTMIYETMRCQPFLLARQQQFNLYLHRIKLMMFSDYCQLTVGQYLNHQQSDLIFNQDIPDPGHILFELKRVNPHYLGDWT